MSKIWRCPNCETINTDNICPICGYKNEKVDNEDNNEGQHKRKKSDIIPDPPKHQKLGKIFACVMAVVCVVTVSVILLRMSRDDLAVSDNEVSGLYTENKNDDDAEEENPDGISNDLQIENIELYENTETVTAVTTKREIVMPSLLNMSYEKAAYILDTIGVQYDVSYSDKKYVDIDTNCVYSQKPASGSKIDESTVVKLGISSYTAETDKASQTTKTTSKTKSENTQKTTKVSSKNKTESQTVTTTSFQEFFYLSESYIELEVGRGTFIGWSGRQVDTVNRWFGVNFSSSDTRIATVDSDGFVEAKSAGMVTITAKCSNGLQDECIVYVNAPATTAVTTSSSVTTSPNTTTSPVNTISDAKPITAETSTVKTVVQPTNVTLDVYNLILTEGDTFVLRYYIDPSDADDKSVTWSSSSSNIASVDRNGNIIAHSPGKAKITAKTSNGKTAVCNVTVLERYIEPTGITLNESSVTISVGEVYILIDTVSPTDAMDKTVKWTSSDISVAKVTNDGFVTGSSAGTAYITAETVNGKTAVCKVTVKNKDIAVKKISLNSTSLSLVEGETAKLIADVSPSDATNKNVKWTTSNSMVAKVSANGEINTVNAGTAEITVYSAENPDIKAVCTVTVTKRQPDIQATAEIDENGNIVVSNSDHVNLPYDAGPFQILQISGYSIFDFDISISDTSILYYSAGTFYPMNTGSVTIKFTLKSDSSKYLIYTINIY